MGVEVKEKPNVAETLATCFSKAYNPEMLEDRASQIAVVACNIRDNGKVIIRDYMQGFSERLGNEPHRLCGNDEYMHPEDVADLLAISAISSAMHDKVDGELNHELVSISEKAMDIIFDNIPLCEANEANQILNSFSRYFIDCLSE